MPMKKALLLNLINAFKKIQIMGVGPLAQWYLVRMMPPLVEVPASMYSTPCIPYILTWHVLDAAGMVFLYTPDVIHAHQVQQWQPQEVSSIWLPQFRQQALHEADGGLPALCPSLFMKCLMSAVFEGLATLQIWSAACSPPHSCSSHSLCTTGLGVEHLPGSATPSHQIPSCPIPAPSALTGHWSGFGRPCGRWRSPRELSPCCGQPASL